MYRILQEEGIDLPRYAVLNRDPDKPQGETRRDTVSFVSQYLDMSVTSHSFLQLSAAF